MKIKQILKIRSIRKPLKLQHIISGRNVKYKFLKEDSSKTFLSFHYIFLKTTYVVRNCCCIKKFKS